MTMPNVIPLFVAMLVGEVFLGLGLSTAGAVAHDFEDLGTEQGNTSGAELVKGCADSAPHPPILIQSNDEFGLAGTGVVAGTGTQSDPYLIEGWCITAHAWPVGYGGACIEESSQEATCVHFPLIAGIRLLNTTAHVVIRDNVLVPPSRILTDQIFEHGHGPPHHQYGITLRGTQNVTIESNQIAHNEWDGVYLFESHHNVIRDNRITNSRTGINLRTSSHNVIEDNRLENLSSNGIFIFGGQSYGATGPSDYNVIQNNTVSTTLHDGIRLWTATNNLIEGNTVRDAHGHHASWSECGYERCRMGIRLQYSSDGNIIIKNQVFENGRGMSIAASSDNWIEGNVIRNSAIYGISTPNDSARNSFVNNTVMNNFIRGISMSPFRDNVVLNNTITNNGGVGVEFHAGGTGELMFRGNRVHGNGWLPYARNGILLQSSGIVFSPDDMEHDGRIVDLSHNWWGTAAGPSGGLEDACTSETASGNGALIRNRDSSLQVCFSPWVIGD